MLQHRLHSACTSICLVKEGIGTEQKEMGQKIGRCSDILQISNTGIRSSPKSVTKVVQLFQ